MGKKKLFVWETYGIVHNVFLFTKKTNTIIIIIQNLTSLQWSDNRKIYYCTDNGGPQIYSSELL
jgi:hypothetical protein